MEKTRPLQKRLEWKQYWACVNPDTDIIEGVIEKREDLEQKLAYDKPVILTPQDAKNINSPEKQGFQIKYKYSQLRHS